MKLLRILIALVAMAALTTVVASDQAPGPKPDGATVVAATPRASGAPAPPQAAATQPGAELPPPPPAPNAQPAAGLPLPPLVPEASAQPPRSDINTCIEVASANLGLATAQDGDAARAAADTLEKYDPPANVRNAIESFVGIRGAMFNDPNFATRNKVISDWVEQLCPNP